MISTLKVLPIDTVHNGVCITHLSNHKCLIERNESLKKR